MEWRKYYLDVILVPLGFMMNVGYHAWLWHMVRTRPLSTIIGTNATARRFWVSSMVKVRIFDQFSPLVYIYMPTYRTNSTILHVHEYTADVYDHGK